MHTSPEIGSKGAPYTSIPRSEEREGPIAKQWEGEGHPVLPCRIALHRHQTADWCPPRTRILRPRVAMLVMAATWRADRCSGLEKVTGVPLTLPSLARRAPPSPRFAGERCNGSAPTRYMHQLARAGTSGMPPMRYGARS